MKNNIDLVKYCIGQVGRPYWYGTYGQISTMELFNNKKKQYPSYYSSYESNPTLGVKVHDCTGLIKGYLMCNGGVDDIPTYQSKYDKNDIGMLNDSPVSGDINTLPDCPGIILWKRGHVGIYVGNGEVVEARSHAIGVIKSKISDVAWVKWFAHKDIDYIDCINTTITNLTVNDIPNCKLNKGCKCDGVSTLQKVCNLLFNSNLAVDGSYGEKTRQAIITIQKNSGYLEVDGVFGNNTRDYIIRRL